MLSEPFVADPETPLSPPGRWFTPDPEVFDDLEPSPHVVVEDSGRVYGYVGSRDTCHLAYPESCVTVPYSASNYGLFHHGPYVVTREGENVRVGTITMGTSHAPDSFGFTASQAHHDDTGHAVVSVRCTDTDRGVLIFGALKPGATREQVYELRARAISGDWRVVAGTQELSGVLAVNSGGFARVRRDGTSGSPTVLIASMRPQATACAEPTEAVGAPARDRIGRSRR